MAKKDIILSGEQNDFIMYHSNDGKVNVALMTCDGNVWLNQQQIATLFATSKQNVGQHIANVLREGELDVHSVVKNYLTTASDGKPYDVMYYSLQMIIAVGFRMRGVRGTQFRQWANNHLSDEDAKLRNRREVLIRETKTHKSVMIAMVTVFGLEKGGYANDIQAEITMDDLFE